MRTLAALLTAVCAASGNSAPPNYWPLTSTTSVMVAMDRIGTFGSGPDASYVTLYGNGIVRISERMPTRDRWVTRYRWLSPLVTARLVDKLATLDFLHLKCEEPWDIDHFTAYDVTLVVPGGTHSVSLINCSQEAAAPLREVVRDVEAIAKHGR